MDGSFIRSLSGFERGKVMQRGAWMTGEQIDDMVIIALGYYLFGVYCFSNQSHPVSAEDDLDAFAR